MVDMKDIVERFKEMVWRTAFQMLRNHADADDCLQDAFMDAVEYARGKTIANWESLLRKIVRRKAIDRLRKRARFREITNEEGIEQIPEREPVPLELSDRLLNALARLPGQQADVFMLSAIDGLSSKEIAALLGITSNLVDVLRHRARRLLRELVTSQS